MNNQIELILMETSLCFSEQYPIMSDKYFKMILGTLKVNEITEVYKSFIKHVEFITELIFNRIKRENRKTRISKGVRHPN